MISKLTFNEQSLLMAKFSNFAYENDRKFDDLGYDSMFINHHGTQTYAIWDKDDIIIVCRGTEPNQLADIASDIEFNLVPSMNGKGLVHYGFNHSVDRIWVTINAVLTKYSNRKVWIAGHSLGAAMATIITTRCYEDETLANPILFTYGSPRVGNHEYIDHMNSLNIEHYRWVNNADIVTRNPLYPYRHHGKLNYFDHHGNIANVNTWQLIKDRIKGFIIGIKKGKINFFVNHSITNYIKNLEKLT